ASPAGSGGSAARRSARRPCGRGTGPASDGPPTGFAAPNRTLRVCPADENPSPAGPAEAGTAKTVPAAGQKLQPCGSWQPSIGIRDQTYLIRARQSKKFPASATSRHPSEAGQREQNGGTSGRLTAISPEVERCRGRVVRCLERRDLSFMVTGFDCRRWD